MKTSSWQDRRLWIGGAALVALFIVAVGWLMFIGPELSSAAGLRTQAGDAQLQNTLLAAKNARLARLNSNLATLQSRLSAACAGLPSDSGLPALTGELTARAASTGITLTAINVGGVTPAGAAAAAPAAAAATGTTGSASTTTPSSSSTTTSSSAPTGTASSTGTAGTATAATAATAGGQYAIPITVVTTGTMGHQVAFLTAIQTGARRALVTSSQVSVTGSSRIASVDANAAMTVQLTVYSAPMTNAQLLQLKRLGASC